jgi:hypothetical protein
VDEELNFAARGSTQPREVTCHPRRHLVGCHSRRFCWCCWKPGERWGYGWESVVLLVCLDVWVKNALNRSLIEFEIFHRECFRGKVSLCCVMKGWFGGVGSLVRWRGIGLVGVFWCGRYGLCVGGGIVCPWCKVV